MVRALIIPGGTVFPRASHRHVKVRTDRIYQREPWTSSEPARNRIDTKWARQIDYHLAGFLFWYRELG